MARININTAPPALLTRLPGIGESMANRIAEYRSTNGNFKNKRDLLNVTGVSERILVPILDRIALTSRASTVSRSTPPASKPATSSSKTSVKPVKKTAATPAKQAAAKSTESKGEKEDAPVAKKNKKEASDKKSKKAKKAGKARKKNKKAKSKTDSGTKAPDLTSADAVAKLANSSGLPAKTMRAVLNTITREKGFCKDGRPAMSFDGCEFRKELKRRGINSKALAKKYPTVVYKKASKKYPLKGLKEYRRLSRALRIHPQAALRSATWGRYQMRGSLFKAAGYKKISEFVSAQHDSEVQQLGDFLKVIQSRKINSALKKQNWKRFVQLYFGANGSNTLAKSLAKACNSKKKG